LSSTLDAAGTKATVHFDGEPFAGTFAGIGAGGLMSQINKLRAE
jgi:hypothetical protein